ncbi:E3 ubiquitin-protein ligase KCMF1 isoform X2 [Anabrus simplex]|uniref:E3 ubiquitin-protein ligase KCMF1 isoform X2 n=1 Tax=Anabrus simplex TaxID=316456 RepID=UPI0034DCF33D
MDDLLYRQMRRLACNLFARREGVSCDACLKGNFRGRRYKCLICYDYDLCATCYEVGATTTRHTTEHPMQCILTRSDFDLYYGGEALTVEQPQAFTCPYCGKMGFTETTLQEHVAGEHPETSFEVVCPVCASLPGGDPNLVTDDFAGHLTLEHRSGPRDLISFLDEPAGSRHGVRRIPHPSRGVGGPRARRSNMHFSSSGGLSSLSPSSRESVDPIAELLSQLSGVRRSAAGQGSTPSQLQQLQMQLQLERQQAARQQLERLPRRQTQAASSANSAGAGTASSAASTATGTHATAPSDSSPNQSTQNSQFLLSRCMETAMSDSELQSAEQERADRSLFVQELVLATLTEGTSSLLLDGLPQDGPGGKKEHEEAGSRASSNSEGASSSSCSPRASPSTSSTNNPGSQQPSSTPQQKVAVSTVPKRSASRGSLSGGATGLPSSVAGTGRPVQPAQQSVVPAGGSSVQHHELRGGIRGGGGSGVLVAQPMQQQVRVVTGTGTIREVVPPPGYGRGSSMRGAGSPGPTRRKPVRPVEGRNQSTEPPPPH